MLRWFSLLRIENPNVLAFRVHVAVAVVQSSQHKIRYKCIEAEIRLLCFAIFSLRILVVLCLLRCTMCTWTLPLAIACMTVSTACLPWQISSDGRNSRHLYCVSFCYPKTYYSLSISYWRWRRGRGTHCCLLFGWFQSETKRYRKHCFTWNGRVEMSKNFWFCSFRVYLMKPTHWRRREMKKTGKYGTFVVVVVGNTVVAQIDNEPRSTRITCERKWKFGLCLFVFVGRATPTTKAHVKNWNRKLKVKSKSLCSGNAGNENSISTWSVDTTPTIASLHAVDAN